MLEELLPSLDYFYFSPITAHASPPSRKLCFSMAKVAAPFAAQLVVHWGTFSHPINLFSTAIFIASISKFFCFPYHPKNELVQSFYLTRRPDKTGFIHSMLEFSPSLRQPATGKSLSSMDDTLTHSLLRVKKQLRSSWTISYKFWNIMGKTLLSC